LLVTFSFVTGLNLRHLKREVTQGHRSRHGLLEEIERHLERTGDQPLEGALEIILEELHRAPQDPHLLRLLALLHERDGDLEGARRILMTAKGDGTDLPSHHPAASLEHLLLEARVLLEANQVAEAEEVARRALSMEPKSLSALNMLARVCHVQGRLSEMIELWRRVQLLAPHREGALVQLGILHRLASDDEAVRMRFVAVGENAYARKHPGQVELESAFAKFRQGDLKGALLACEHLASTSREKVPALQKLAVLQKAWFQERTDDLESAHATLQAFGRERGFEVDFDRLGFLARICERLGTPAALSQAIHIHEHLNIHFGKLSSLPRLVALYQAIGDSARAEAYSREFQRRFARRMQKPLVPEIVHALARHYVRLSAFPRLSIGAEDSAGVERELRLASSVAGRQRRRALLAHFAGDSARARRIWRRLTQSRSATAKDFGYLADSLASAGQAREAHASYLEAVRRAPASVALWRQLLSGLAAGQDERPVKALLADPAIRNPAHEALRRSAIADHADPRPWQDLALIERFAGLEEDAARHEQKARALQQALSRSPELGRVLVAAAYALYGKPKGIVHEIVATRRLVTAGAGGVLEEGGILGSVTPDLSAVVRLTLATALDFARAHWPHLAADTNNYVYALKIAKEDEPSSGSSAGLPVALAFLSLILGRRVPSDLAVSGSLVSDSQRHVVLRRIGDAPHKVKGAYHRNLSMILLPEENRPDVECGDVVPLTVARELVRYAADLSQAIEIVWGREVWET